MSNSHRGAFYGGAGPLRSREGIARAAANSDEIQLRIDPMHADLDEEIVGLRTKLSQLKSVAQEIGSEAKFQNDFISQLHSPCFTRKVVRLCELIENGGRFEFGDLIVVHFLECNLCLSPIKPLDNTLKLTYHPVGLSWET
ncbi:hypothetical protein ACLOJK_016416 [Asimina triloba]